MSKAPAPRKTVKSLTQYLSSYSLEALLALKKEIDSEVESRKASATDAQRAKIAENAQTRGVPAQDIAGIREPVVLAPAARGGFRRFRAVLAAQGLDSTAKTCISPPPAGSAFASLFLNYSQMES